jgi:hypothetical protein
MKKLVKKGEKERREAPGRKRRVRPCKATMMRPVSVEALPGATLQSVCVRHMGQAAIGCVVVRRIDRRKRSGIQPRGKECAFLLWPRSAKQRAVLPAFLQCLRPLPSSSRGGQAWQNRKRTNKKVEASRDGLPSDIVLITSRNWRIFSWISSGERRTKVRLI